VDQYRQGDVFLTRVSEIPADATQAPVKGPVVLALGESSGHRHQIAKGAKLFQRGSARYLEVSAKGGAILRVTSGRGTPLTPERHEPISLPPGKYEVMVQNEWTSADEIRRVQD
jgi:hypothetical protein